MKIIGNSNFCILVECSLLSQLRTDSGCFCTAVAPLSSFDRDRMAPKPKIEMCICVFCVCVCVCV